MMEISNNIGVVKKTIESSEAKKIDKNVNHYTESENGLLLPDIRGNQVLLPNNKVYNAKPIKLPKFNERQLQVTMPEHYQKVDRLNESNITTLAREVRFPNYKIDEVLDKKTGEHFIRGVKNNYTKEGVVKSTEVMEMSLSRKNAFSKSTRYIEDYEHNTVTEIRMKNPMDPYDVAESFTTISKDKDGKVAKRMDYVSSPVKNVYDIYETDASGKTRALSKANVEKDGSYAITKNLKSLDGTTTKYKFKSDKAGHHKSMFCQIKDKDGKVLSTIDRTYDKENENVTYSTVNGNKYKAVKDGNNLEITNYTTGEVTKMNSKKMMAKWSTKMGLKLGGAVSGREMSKENVANKLFDTLPADTLLNLNRNITQIVPMKDDLDSAFMPVYNYLLANTDNFVVAHELGHSRDSRTPKDFDKLNFRQVKELNQNQVSGQKDFYNEYINEKAAFKKAFPDCNQQFIDYFLDTPEDYLDRGRSETVAESNAINGLQPAGPEVIAMRTTILQQYFPRSIAEATKIMNPVAVKDVEVEPQQQETSKPKFKINLPWKK